MGNYLMRMRLLLILGCLVFTGCSPSTSLRRVMVGISMEPNFHDGQIVEINVVEISTLTRGDVILIQVDDKEYLKRLIGLPGEEIELRDGYVLVDNERLDEPYEVIPSEYDYGPLILKEDEYFVLGDDRDHSFDSRMWGAVLAENILGRIEP